MSTHKKNAPAGVGAPDAGASEKCHLQYNKGGENVNPFYI